jgi:5'-3' exonuclease
MGIPDFLSKVLETAGRSIDLRDYVEGQLRGQGHKRRRRRQLRIGIDITVWVYKAAHGFGDMLSDGRHLTNYGRAALLEEQEQDVSNDNEEQIEGYVVACTKYVMKRLEILRDESKADLLVVLDGETPPVKAKEVQRRRKVRGEHVRQRDEPLDPNEIDIQAANEKRTKANRRAGAGRHFTRIIHELIKCLRKSQIAFLVAPYEADSQLAYLSKKEFIDLIITEDSDLVAYGARAVLYKAVTEIGNGKPRGILLQYEALGSVSGKLDLSDFSPVMMAVLFVAVGCDYCEKLKGIGIMTAARIVRQAFQESSTSTVSVLFVQMYGQCYERKLSDEYKRKYEERFLAALFMYQHPVIYDPVQGKAVMQGGGDLWGESVLMKHKAYAELCEDQDRISHIVGVMKEPEAATAAATAVGIGDAPEAEGEGNNGNTEEEGSRADCSDDRTPASHALETQQGATSSVDQADKEANDGAGLNNHALEKNDGPQQAAAFPQVEQPQMEIDDLDSENGHELETQLLNSQQATPFLERAAGEESDEPDASESPALESQQLNTQLETAPQQQEAESESTLDQDQIDKEKTKNNSGEHPEPFSEIQMNDDSENRGGSENHETRSPNLLYSSTPEKTAASQGDQTTSTLSIAQSPNLLYSSTPEKTGVSQGDDFLSMNQ